MKLSHRRGWLMLTLLAAFAAPGLAAESPVLDAAAGGDAILIEPQPQPWGTASSTALVVGPGQFTPPFNTVTWVTLLTINGVGLYQTSPVSNVWWYQFHLPSGALLQRVELEACDTSTTAGIEFGAERALTPGGTVFIFTPVGTTGIAAAPGCAFFSLAPTSATTIDNAGNDYWVFFYWQGTGFSGTTSLHAFRFYYRLQVSPAPATATFPNDVPTSHPFFRFVEAMAASGLTGGCGPGAYCPDQPVTRGQMAVFLSNALGLHFPN